MEAVIANKTVNMEDLPALFTEEELRKVVFNDKISRNRCYELIHSNGFPTVKVGRKLYISKEGFKKWIEKNMGSCLV